MGVMLYVGVVRAGWHSLAMHVPAVRFGLLGVLSAGLGAHMLGGRHRINYSLNMKVQIRLLFGLVQTAWRDRRADDDNLSHTLMGSCRLADHDIDGGDALPRMALRVPVQPPAPQHHLLRCQRDGLLRGTARSQGLSPAL